MTTNENRNGRDNSSNPNNNRTNDNNSSKPNSNSSSGFYRDLTDRLRNLSFTPFQNCILLWLGAKGYHDIYVLRRSAARGRRQVGGADFIAESPHNRGVKVAIQVRHWKTPVQRRAVDELWGFMLRQGIPQGLIVTNSVFYPRALAASLEFPGRPIRLVSVPQLTGSLAALGLGVEPLGDRLAISEPFFRSLEGMRLASSLMANSGRPQGNSGKSGNRSAGLDSVSTNPPFRPDDDQLNWWIVLVMAVLLLLGLWFTYGVHR